jgi:hypothetical protein
MPERVADLCRSIQEEHDPKKFTALVDKLIRVLDKERKTEINKPLSAKTD